MRGRVVAALAVAGVLGMTLAACGGEDEKPVAEVSGLKGKTTKVILAGGFVEALGELKLEPAPFGKGKLAEGELSFPITGGEVTYYKPGTVDPYVQGEILHEGSGFSLTAGDKEVELTDFKIDPGSSKLNGKVTVDGEVAEEDAELFYLDGSTLKPLVAKKDGTAVLEGATVNLSEDAAKLLNDTFGVDALKKNVKIGKAKITVETK